MRGGGWGRSEDEPGKHEYPREAGERVSLDGILWNR